MNDSGIKSLAGFSFQIKAFVYYLSKLNNHNDVLGFETFEDISKKSLLINEDDGCDFVTTWEPANSLEAIQVKRTKISKSVAKKIMLNWILIENELQKEITKFVLITIDDSVTNEIFDDLGLKELVKGSVKKANSLEGQVKKIISDDYERINSLVESIKAKIEIENIGEIDKRVFASFERIFHRRGVTDYIFSIRIDQFIQYICSQIFKEIDRGNSYQIDYSRFMTLVEEITTRITDDEIDLDYYSFKENHKNETEINLISSTREYKQLKKCEINEGLLKTFFLKRSYYQHYRYLHMEMNLYSPIDNIEETSFENYELSVSELQNENKDKPFNRLMATIKKNNSYAKNDQIKDGACIHLTGDKEKDRLITWGED